MNLPQNISMDDFFLLTEKDSTQQIGNELQVIFSLLPDFLIHNESGKYYNQDKKSYFRRYVQS